MAKMFLMNSNNDLDTSQRGFSFVTDQAYRRQKLLIRLAFFLGEWFLDTTAGFDYFGIVFVKNPDLVLIEAELKQYILDTDGIESFIDYNQTFDGLARTFTVNFKVLDIDNNIISIDEVIPLL